MKLTPEQKAFFEYGKALGELKMFRKNHQSRPCVQNRPMRHFWRKAPVWCNQKETSNRHVKLIRHAWQKRAACRRTCGQCVYFSPDEWGPRKDGCLKRCCGVKSNRCAVGCRYWELKKEGE